MGIASPYPKRPHTFLNDSDIILLSRVQARDRFGNEQRFDPSDIYDTRVLWDVKISGDGGTAADMVFKQTSVETPQDLTDGLFQVEHSSEGTYLVMLRTILSQTVAINMALNGIPIANDGAIVFVAPGLPSIPDTILTRTISRTATGESRTIYIQSRDAYGNFIQEGGIDFRVSLSMLESIAMSGNGDNPLTAQDKVVVEFEDDGFGRLVQVFSREGNFYFDHNFKISASVDITDNEDGTYRIRYRSDQVGFVGYPPPIPVLPLP